MMNPDTELEDYNDFADTRVLTIPDAHAGERLDAVLATLMPDFSRSRISGWIKDGHVLVDGEVFPTKHKVCGGEKVVISIASNPEETTFTPEDIDLDVLYEDEAIIVINKCAGLVVHPGSGNWTGTLLNALLFHYPELKTIPRAGIVHRLDKDTSGVMVVARTLSAQNNLVQQLQARSVKRQYLAIANGLVSKDGTVDAAIGRHPKDRIKMAVVHTGKPAITHYRVLERFTGHTLVECKLETGRTHQIRVHMTHIGHALAADPVYGGKPRIVSTEVTLALEEFNRQALHARQLTLVHPVSGKTMSWKAPIPEDFDLLLCALRAEMGLAEEDWEDDWDEDDDHDCEIMYVRE